MSVTIPTMRSARESWLNRTRPRVFTQRMGLVRQDDPVIDLVVGALVNRAGDGAVKKRLIVKMNEAKESAVGAGKFTGGPTVDLFQGFRPPETPSQQVVIPDPHMTGIETEK